MILKLKMKDESKKNIDIIKSNFFDSTDKITAGYIIGLAVEKTHEITDEEWEGALNSILCRNGHSDSKSTSVSLRHEIFDNIIYIKEKLQGLCGKTLHMSQVIDIILFVIANRLCSNENTVDTLIAMEWNLNGRSAFSNYIVPVNLIANEVINENPHIFVFTEFVQSAGWIDLKSILQEKYNIFESPYTPKQNGICIGVQKNSGIEYLDSRVSKTVFETYLNLPDFYEVKVKINSQIISIIGTRIKIDSYKANSRNPKIRIDEQKQRFEQYQHLIKYIANFESVIVLGDFNNSRIIGDEDEGNKHKINEIYEDKDSIEYNFQKIKSYIAKKSNNKILLQTAKGNLSSMGATCTDTSAAAPKENINYLCKYDHIISNYIAEEIKYSWDFLKNYNGKEYFVYNNRSERWEIKAGYPDHAIMLAKIKLTGNNSCKKEEFKETTYE